MVFPETTSKLKIQPSFNGRKAPPNQCQRLSVRLAKLLVEERVDLGAFDRDEPRALGVVEALLPVPLDGRIHRARAHVRRPVGILAPLHGIRLSADARGLERLARQRRHPVEPLRIRQPVDDLRDHVAEPHPNFKDRRLRVLEGIVQEPRRNLLGGPAGRLNEHSDLDHVNRIRLPRPVQSKLPRVPFDGKGPRRGNKL